MFLDKELECVSTAGTSQATAGYNVTSFFSTVCMPASKEFERRLFTKDPRFPRYTKWFSTKNRYSLQA
ncbi:hypothetical protein AVO44_05620 [Ruegeria profundi]|uniref:Uncharacterized protein n=1 Tax=Ruegeria profundi TaxID=1685378 RepID=A0A0X3U0E9_9RHOB|nr:hypothetical protein AVO44_05620 [Ruegeria profundi]